MYFHSFWLKASTTKTNSNTNKADTRPLERRVKKKRKQNYRQHVANVLGENYNYVNFM